MNLVVAPSSETLTERDILGVKVAVLDRAHAIGLIEARLRAGVFTRLAFLNAHCSNVAWRNENYRAALSNFLVLADGVGVDIASRALHGEEFPDNLNGTDFIPDLLTSIRQPLRVGLIGSTRRNVEGAAEAFRRLAPHHDFVVVSDGFFAKADTPAMLKRVAGLNLDVLLVAMGVPLQEVFIAGQVNEGHVRVAAGVGALFDFMSGAAPRAPEWVRAWRLEWLYRLAHEPVRLFRRYVIGNPVFIARVYLRKLFARDG